jgi:hypothetical protein
MATTDADMLRAFFSRPGAHDVLLDAAAPAVAHRHVVSHRPRVEVTVAGSTTPVRLRFLALAETKLRLDASA